MEILVSTDWLADNIDTHDLVVLDASSHLPAAGRDARAEYLKRHVLGARFLDLPSLKDETSDVPAALPSAEQFAHCLGSLGVKPSDQVVLYDDSRLRSSARAFFIFTMFGFDNVALLDGGFEKWHSEGRPVEFGQPDIVQSGFRPVSNNHENVRDKAAMLVNCGTGAEQVVDARDAARFTGEEVDTVHGLPGGHIPGARNLFFRDLLAADGSFEATDALHAEFAKAGLDLARPITASCGSGMTASVILFAMQLLERQGSLYDGSWSEWGADPATPKETGPMRPEAH